MRRIYHDDVIKWKHFPRYWPPVRDIHPFPVNSPYKGQWRGALMFSLVCARRNGYVNKRDAGDFRRYRAHYDVTVMTSVYSTSISTDYGLSLFGTKPLSKLSVCKMYNVGHFARPQFIRFSHVGDWRAPYNWVSTSHAKILNHDDVIKWKYFPRYWPFVRGIHRWPVNSPHKGQWCGALMFSLICIWINGWVNNREAGDFRRYRAHYDVSVM